MIKWNFVFCINFEDHNNYIPDFREHSEYSSNVIQYVGGCIIMKLKRNLRYEACVATLILDKEATDSLTSIKSHGRLIHPSTDQYVKNM